MKMEVLAVQSNYGGVLGSNKVRDWTSTLTPPASATVVNVAAAPKTLAKKATSSNSSSNGINNNNNNMKNNHSIKHSSSSSQSSSNNKKIKPSSNYSIYSSSSSTNSRSSTSSSSSSSSTYYSQSIEDELANDAANDAMHIDDSAAVAALSLRLLDELRAAKSRHLTCTEVSLPCDLTPSIAADIIRVSEKEPCGIRGCTINIEFEDEPLNSRRIASLKLDPETVSTFEVYVTLRQDHRGWTSLLPQFMKSLARTITISREYTITKYKLYSADAPVNATRRSYSFGSSQAIATPTI